MAFNVESLVWLNGSLQRRELPLSVANPAPQFLLTADRSLIPNPWLRAPAQVHQPNLGLNVATTNFVQTPAVFSDVATGEIGAPSAAAKLIYSLLTGRLQSAGSLACHTEVYNDKTSQYAQTAGPGQPLDCNRKDNWLSQPGTQPQVTTSAGESGISKEADLESMFLLERQPCIQLDAFHDKNMAVTLEHTEESTVIQHDLDSQITLDSSVDFTNAFYPSLRSSAPANICDDMLDQVLAWEQSKGEAAFELQHIANLGQGPVFFEDSCLAAEVDCWQYLNDLERTGSSEVPVEGYGGLEDLLQPPLLSSPNTEKDSNKVRGSTSVQNDIMDGESQRLLNNHPEGESPWPSHHNDILQPQSNTADDLAASNPLMHVFTSFSKGTANTKEALAASCAVASPAPELLQQSCSSSAASSTVIESKPVKRNFSETLPSGRPAVSSSKRGRTIHFGPTSESPSCLESLPDTPSAIELPTNGRAWDCLPIEAQLAQLAASPNNGTTADRWISVSAIPASLARIFSQG